VLGGLSLAVALWAYASIVERRQRAFRYLYKTALVIFGLALAVLVYAV
jgi:hypothetical protein